jgi:hypothetical protein
MANISDFKAALIGGGARSNLFQIGFTFPAFVQGGTIASQQMAFLASSASLPETSVKEIAVPFQGRDVYVAGEREFGTWDIEIYNDTSFSIRNPLEQWVNSIQNPDSLYGLTDPASYQVNAAVYQLDRTGAILQYYEFIDMWPTKVEAIQLSYESASVEKFRVTLRYNYFVNPSIPANAQITVNANFPI